MLSGCVKAVYWLFKVLVQPALLCTVSTVRFVFGRVVNLLYVAKPTGFAQFYCAFTQVVLGIFNPLTVKLCTVSTPTMITTNLIKD
jgi:hypothetical protein